MRSMDERIFQLAVKVAVTGRTWPNGSGCTSLGHNGDDDTHELALVVE